MQVNYHGPYILTRLLEPVLIASKPSRVVNVASVEHRIGYIKDIRKFMFDAKKFLYSETKLGNVLLTYEHQRRLGPYGVQVCYYSRHCNDICTSALPLPPPPTMPGPDPGPGPGVSTSTAFVVYQYCLCCLPVLPLLSTSTAFLSTSTASVVYQYCLCCLPVLPCCLPLGPGMLLYYAVTVNPLKTLCILTQQPALRCASLSTDSCCFASKTESLRLHIS